MKTKHNTPARRAVSALLTLCMALALFAGLGLGLPLPAAAADDTIDLSTLANGSSGSGWACTLSGTAPSQVGTLTISQSGTYTLQDKVAGVGISSLRIQITSGADVALTAGSDYDGKNLYIVDERSSAQLTLKDISFQNPASGATLISPSGPTSVLYFSGAGNHTLTIAGAVSLEAVPSTDATLAYGIYAAAPLTITAGAQGGALTTMGANGSATSTGQAIVADDAPLTVAGGLVLTANAVDPGARTPRPAVAADGLTVADANTRLVVNGPGILTGAVPDDASHLVNVAGVLTIGAAGEVILSGGLGSAPLLKANAVAQAGALTITSNLGPPITVAGNYDFTATTAVLQVAAHGAQGSVTLNDTTPGTTASWYYWPAIAVDGTQLPLKKTGQLFTFVNGATNTVQLVPAPPSSLTANPAQLAAAGGDTVVTVTDTMLPATQVAAFDGADRMVGSAQSITIGGSATLALPANPSTTADAVYTIKASLDSGATWLDAPTATVTVGKAPPADATIAPATAAFDKNAPTDLSVTFSPGGYTLGKLTCDGADLAAGSQYTASAGVYTFNKAWLATLSNGSHSIVFVMNGGANPALALAVSDSTPVNHDPIATPDPNTPIDLSKDAVLSFHGAYANLAAVKLNGTLLIQTPTDANSASLSGYPGYGGNVGNVRSGSVVVTLYKEFLRTLPSGSYTLEVLFNDGGVPGSGSLVFTIVSAPASTPASSPAAPQTGDNSNIPLWAALLVISLLALATLIGLLVQRRRRSVR